MITYRTLHIKVSEKSGEKLRNTLDRRCQSRKAYDREACSTHSGGLKHPVYDSHTNRYRFNCLVAYIKEEKENPVGRAAGQSSVMH